MRWGNYPGLVLNKNWSLSLSHPIQNVGLEWIFTAEGQEWTRSIEKGEVSLGNYEQRMEISLNVFANAGEQHGRSRKQLIELCLRRRQTEQIKLLVVGIWNDVHVEIFMFEASWAGELSLLKLFC